MSPSSKRFVTIYLATLVAGLGYLNWWRAATPIDISPIASSPASNPGQPNADPSADGVSPPLALADLTETIKRPLFRADRRPPAAAPKDKPELLEAAPAIEASTADGLRFIGTMRTGAATERALIRIAGNPAATWVEQGSGIGGWTVKAIEANRVILQRNGDTAELKLYVPGPTTAAP